MKKILSILLSVFVCFSYFSVFACTEEICKIHSDADFDGICENCSENVLQNKIGVNTYYYIMGNEVLMLVLFEDPQLNVDLHLTLIYRYELDVMQYIHCVEHEDSEFDIEEHDYYEIEYFPKGDICTPGTYELFKVSYKITKENFSIEDLPVITLCGAGKYKVEGHEPVIIEANHDHVDETFDSTCDICGCRYYTPNNHVHVDNEYDFICNLCTSSVYADKTGINTSVLKTHYVVMYQVYTSGVTDVNEIEYKFSYDSSALTYHGVQYNNAFDVDLKDDNGIIIVKMKANDSYQMNSESDILFIALFEEGNRFTDDDFPKKESVFADGVITSDGSNYVVSTPVYMKTKHEFRDFDLNNFCDVCNLVKKHDCAKNVIDGKCKICGEPVYYYGDMNNDGYITAADARIALRISAKIQNATEYDLIVGDFNGDGKITAAEARKILRVAALIDSF